MLSYVYRQLIIVEANRSMPGMYDPALVVLSVLIAIVASYTALDLASRIRASATRTSAVIWLVTAAAAMGGGIWSMHFIAMLAFSMPGMDASYDVGLTILSMLLAMVVTGVGFVVVSRPSHGWPALTLSGIFMGIGIAGMHYTGMAAMRMPVSLDYDPLWVVISVLIAIIAAIVALWLAFRKIGFLQKAIASVLMGFAVSGMHFAGMRAAIFGAHVMEPPMEPSGFNQTGLALAVAGTTFFILALALVASIFDRRFALLAEKEAVALRHSEEQFRSLYRRTPLPLHSFDHDGRLTEVSDSWLHLFDRRREEVLGSPFEIFMTEQSAAKWRADWPRLLSDGQLPDTEYQLVAKGGDIVDVLASSRVESRADGSFLSVLGGLVDVTARKRIEAALRQAQKMDAIGQLTGGVAHDFNNLLAVVLGSLDMLGKRIGDDPKALRLLDAARESARRGATLTQRMLSFARQQSLNPEPVDVPELVKGMEDMLQRSLGPLVRIDALFSPGPLVAHVDAHQLELAVLNLVVNARDAMGDVGAVVISAERHVLREGEVAHLPAGPYIRLSVRDSGEGMDELTLARAREPFFTTKGVAKGTGLGLSMVDGFAQQSGGALLLHSQPGMGTTAEILLPVAEAKIDARAEGAELPAPDRGGAGALTVLAVDDDMLVLMNTVAMLEELGHQVVSANSGQSALEILARQEPIDLILTDHAMPGMSGMALAQTVRKQNPHMPIAILTGYAEISGNGEMKLPVLGKPFTQQQLEKTVIDAVSKKVVAASA
jgi:PAS domain S-box-containing protein